MRYLILAFVCISILCSAQKKDTVYSLGPVYENILWQQEQLKKQYDDAEKMKEAFLVGYFAGKGRTLSEADSVVWVSPSAVVVRKKSKPKK